MNERFSRRDLFKIFGGVAFTTVACSEGAAEKESISLESRIEEKFKIHLISDEEGTNIRAGNPQQKLTLPSSWTDERINNLEYALLNVPEYFYEPDAQNKLMFEAIRVPWNQGGNCICSPELTKNLPQHISLNGELLNEKEETRRIVTHELIHRISYSSLDDEGNPVMYKDIENILGKNYNDIFNEIDSKLEKIATRVPGKEGNYTVQAELAPFFTTMKYVIGKHTGARPFSHIATEFMPSISEFYIQGKDEYLKKMSLVFSSEESISMYDYLRDTIFQGKEYSKR